MTKPNQSAYIRKIQNEMTKPNQSAYIRKIQNERIAVLELVGGKVPETTLQGRRCTNCYWFDIDFWINELKYSCERPNPKTNRCSVGYFKQYEYWVPSDDFISGIEN